MSQQKTKQPTTDIPIGIASKPPIAKRNLDDWEPGATREDVLRFIEKVAKSPKPSRKRAEPIAPAS